MKRFERDTSCSATITVQFYFVVEQGRPIEEADIRRAIDVCEEAYKGCSWDGSLMDRDVQAAFAKQDLANMITHPFLNTSSTSMPQDLLGLTSVFPGSSSTIFPSPVTQVSANPNEPMLPPKAGVFDAQYNALSCLGELAEAVRTLPSNEAGYAWLHAAGLARLAKPEQLDAAFHFFRLSNDLYTQVHGRPWSSALYNMACCEAVAVHLQIQRYRTAIPLVGSLAACSKAPELAGGLVAPELPPLRGSAGNTVASLCEARLDAAMSWLSTAIGAGNCQYGHMASDPDLQVLRELRPQPFWAIVGLAKSMA